jgi:transposase
MVSISLTCCGSSRDDSTGDTVVEELAAVVGDENDGRIPASARKALLTLTAELAALDLRITRLETEIVTRARTDAVARRLATIPGIGPIIASRLSAMVPDASIFRSARDFAAWIGLVPRQRLDRRQAAPRRHLQTRQC